MIKQIGEWKKWRVKKNKVLNVVKILGRETLKTAYVIKDGLDRREEFIQRENKQEKQTDAEKQIKKQLKRIRGFCEL